MVGMDQRSFTTKARNTHEKFFYRSTRRKRRNLTEGNGGNGGGATTQQGGFTTEDTKRTKGPTKAGGDATPSSLEWLGSTSAAFVTLYVQRDDIGQGQRRRRLPRMGPKARRRKPSAAGLLRSPGRAFVHPPGRRSGRPPPRRQDRPADPFPEA